MFPMAETHEEWRTEVELGWWVSRLFLSPILSKGMKLKHLPQIKTLRLK